MMFVYYVNQCDGVQGLYDGHVMRLMTNPRCSRQNVYFNKIAINDINYIIYK